MDYHTKQKLWILLPAIGSIGLLIVLFFFLFQDVLRPVAQCPVPIINVYTSSCGCQPKATSKPKAQRPKPKSSAPAVVSPAPVPEDPCPIFRPDQESKPTLPESPKSAPSVRGLPADSVSYRVPEVPSVILFGAGIVVLYVGFGGGRK